MWCLDDGGEVQSGESHRSVSAESDSGSGTEAELFTPGV